MSQLIENARDKSNEAVKGHAVRNAPCASLPDSLTLHPMTRES